MIDERLIALVDIRRQELGGLRIGAGNDQGRHAHHVGGEAGGGEVADMCLCRDQHLAAEMAALLFRSELVLEMHAGSARLDKGLHDFEGVERPAEAGFGIGYDRREPGIDRQARAFRRFDLVGALQRAVDPLGEFRCGVGRVKRLVGIHGGRRVGIGRDLPAGQVDRLQAGAHHLHGLIAGQRAKRIDEILLVDELPQAVRAVLGQGVADLHRTAQALHIRSRIRAFDAIEAALRGGRDKVVKSGH